ncbi:hypothetical protein ABPG77_003252 [Micractinium sp. CCAP 211/92]
MAHHRTPAHEGIAHPLALSPQVSALGSGLYSEDIEQASLLPDHHSHSHKPSHKHSFSGQIDSQWRAFQVAMFKPAPAVILEGPAASAAGDSVGDSQRSGRSTLENEPFLTIEDVRPSAATNEWLLVGTQLLPKVSWGWLPFCFTFLGFGPALKLLLFITLFSVYSAAVMWRLYQHSDHRGTTSLADIGEAALGRRLGRNIVTTLVRAIDFMLPSVMHVGGTRFLQCWLFYSTNVCLPWISLLFGAVVLGLVQVQRLGSHPAMTRIVQPVLTAVAVAATLAKLLLMHGAERREVARAAAAGSPPAVQAPDTDLPYFSDAVIAVIQLISANYMGQHFFMEEMSGMSSAYNFQHSTAWAQVCTLLANVAVAAATLQVTALSKVHGFISFAFQPDLLSRFINFVMWILMTVKYVITLHNSTKSLLPRLPHLLIAWFDDPDGVDGPFGGEFKLRPRQLWLLCSSVIVTISFLVSGTFPHTFMYLSGLLTSLCYIPLAYTLPCIFSLRLLGSKITALEYTLSTWVIPVSITLSLLGCWASLYHMALKWSAADRNGSWGCNLLRPH